MLFPAKTKTFFLEQNEHSILVARTSAAVPPLVVEELREVPLADTAALADVLRQIQPRKSPSGYLNAICGAYPPRRLVRRATLELKRIKEPGYFAEILTQQFRIEPDKYTVHVINSPDGSDYDFTKPSVQKEVLFCGLPSEDVVALQDGLLERGVYPDRLELGSIALLGGVVDYLAFRKSKTPTLVLEIGADATHSFIVSAGGVETSRPIPQGLDAMVPVIQKELGLKDEESARKLFYSDTFDFTGMGPLLLKRLLKELQSSIGFYEVQTGQSVGQVLCAHLPPKLAWLESAMATSLGIAKLELDLPAWLDARRVTVGDAAVRAAADPRWLGLFSLMVQVNPTDAAAAKKES
jgi:hypothetical protein